MTALTSTTATTAGTAPRTYLGIDIGGTKVAFRLAGETDDSPTHDEAFAWPARHSADRDWEHLADRVRRLLGTADRTLAGVGVALPAAVDAAGRVTAWPSRPEWTGFDIGDRFRALFPAVDVRWADDGSLGALAEARAAGAEDVLYLGVGTGVGGGLVLGGRLVPPPGSGSFEIGHTVVRLDGPACVCGRSGCLQASASGPATLRRAAELRAADVDFDTLCAGVRDGSPWALAAVTESSRALAAAITSVRELVQPRIAVLGGGFAAGVPGLVEAVARQTAAMARPGFPAVPVLAARCAGLSSLRGAVWLGRMEG